MNWTLTPEQLAVVLVVLILYGPTVLWVAYRALRSHPTRSPIENIAPVASAEVVVSAQDQAAALTHEAGYWVCAECHSIVRPEANKCYRCRAARTGVEGADGGVPDGTAWVPVMTPRVVNSGAPSATTAADRAVAGAAPAFEVPTAVSAQAAGPVPYAPQAGPVACPYLGMRDDLSTYCEFPDARNACHAAAPGRLAASGTSPRRDRGRKRSQRIDLAHQASHCLTAEHSHCARYPAVEVLAGRR